MKIGINNITFSMLSYLNLLVPRERYWEDAVVSAYNADVHWYFVLLRDSLTDDYTKTSIATKEADRAEVKFKVCCWRV